MPEKSAVGAPSALSLAEFKFERAVFEVRYPPALLLWDRAGELWSDATEKWEGLAMVTAAPDRTVFKLEPNQEFAVELGAARLVQHWPTLSLEDFTQNTRSFVGLVATHLEIRTLSRIGLRLFFFREFPDREAAGAALLGTGLVLPPEGRYFGSGDAPLSADCNFVWENKSIGIRAALAYQRREYKLERPLGLIEIEARDIRRDGVVFDIDFYTTSAVEVGQLGVEEWVGQHVRALKRDVDAFLGGVRK